MNKFWLPGFSQRRFEEWKEESEIILSFLLFYIFIIPLSILLHEIGHGIGVVSSSRSHARIYLGNWGEKNRQNFRIGRLHFYIHWSYFGYCSWDHNLNKQQKICALAGGPLMSLLLVCISLIMVQDVPQGNLRSVINGITIFNLANFLFTGIPMNYPRWFGPLGGHPSDGLQLLRLLKMK